MQKLHFNHCLYVETVMLTLVLAATAIPTAIPQQLPKVTNNIAANYRREPRSSGYGMRSWVRIPAQYTG